MENIYFDYSNSMINYEEIENIRNEITDAHNKLHRGTGQGKEFLGWIDYPINYDENEFNKVKIAANKIRSDSQVLLVIGIGGSYLGSKAVIKALEHVSNCKSIRTIPEIYFLGNNLSSTYFKHILDVIENKDISINVISKSGTTTETAIAFRILKKYIEDKYGKEEARKRIYATTDSSKGALKKLSDKEGYEVFTIPNNIGGRYSVFTPVGLLPIAVAGLDIDMIMEGARDGRREYSSSDISNNHCYQYAAIRNILYRKGKIIEILVNYEPYLQYMSEWWKQLYGESEGKNGKGIFPASVNFTTDLHSMGQYIQDGRREIFETVINILNSNEDILIEHDADNIDGLNYLAGKTINEVNKMAYEGALRAHVKGKVPNLILNVPMMNEYYIGKLMYFFEKACGISGYLLGVNPFNQPGVELYKKNMFQLLGKPGYEKK